MKDNLQDLIEQVVQDENNEDKIKQWLAKNS